MNVVFSLLIFALINSCIEVEISAPSFPSIMSYFSVAENVVSLTITTNLIGLCIAACLYGPLSDAFGRRHIMLVGNAILAIGAIGCVIAPSIHFLLLARFIQGLGAAASAVVVPAIISDLYKPSETSRLYGLLNAVLTTLMALAPIIGGFINSAIGWRGTYGVVAFICVISWFLLVVFFPETIKKKQHLTFKKVISDYKKLLSSRMFLFSASVPSMLYGCYIVFIAIGPFIYMQTLQLSMIDYTLHTAIVVATFAMVSSVVGKITDYIGTQKALVIALSLQIIGPLVMCFDASSVSFTCGMSIFSLGDAVVFPIIFARSMEIFPKIKGAASSAIMSLRYLICAGLTAVASYM